MKSSLILIAAALAFAVACNPSKTDNSSPSDSTAIANAPTVTEPVNVILWTEIGLRENPDEGKFVTMAYIGEHFEITGDTATKVVSGKTQKYHKIKLTDGKTGWVRDEFLAIHVIPAAVVNGADVYKRPDITTIMPKTFNSGDYLVIRKDEGEFAEVIGKISEEKWFTSGYVLSKDISVMDIDVRFAALLQRARDEKKPDTEQMLFAQAQNADVFGESQIWKLFYEPTEGESDEYGSEMGDGYEEDPGDAAGPMQLNPPENGLIAHYNMDHLDMYDETANDHDGELFGNVTADVDINGAQVSAYSFDGASYATIPWEGDPVKPPFTVVAYFKTDDLTVKDQCVVSKGRSREGTGFNFGYTVKDNGQRVFYFGMIGVSNPVSVEAPANLQANEWVYLAGSFDLKTAKLYVNGTLVASTNIGADDANEIVNNLGNSTEPLEIGRELSTLNRYFKGTIDNVALWNRALTVEEIESMRR